LLRFAFGQKIWHTIFFQSESELQNIPSGTVISEVPPVTTLVPAVKKNAATKQSKPTVLMPPKTDVLGSTIPVCISWHGKLIQCQRQ
jgi:hypothetical protein